MLPGIARSLDSFIRINYNSILYFIITYPGSIVVYTYKALVVNASFLFVAV